MKIGSFSLFAVGLAVFGLNACSTTQSIERTSPYSQANAIKSQGGTYKIGNPYQIMGQYYVPAEDYEYTEVGMASWYGRDFHAKKTANGENYDMNTLTAAHRTLPLPSIVKVTNLENGRSLVLRVNDRGPFVKNRIIDVSKRAAMLLGFLEQGTAKVRVNILAHESKELKAALLGEAQPIRPTPVARIATDDLDRNVLVGAEQGNVITNAAAAFPGTGRMYVQAGSFSYKSSADELSSKLNGVGNVQVMPADVDGNRFYRVRVGPFYQEDEANAILAKVKDAGIYSAKVIYD